jgi:hypothetical protein
MLLNYSRNILIPVHSKTYEAIEAEEKLNVIKNINQQG